eukprot:scaffold119952_cov25-Prasinocladus_malaysianus.AAC.1
MSDVLRLYKQTAMGPDYNKGPQALLNTDVIEDAIISFRFDVLLSTVCDARGLQLTVLIDE